MERFVVERCTMSMAVIFYSLSSLFIGANPLTLKEFVIPSKLVVGSTVTLSCVLDLGGDVLQSIKWYKDGTELCSYGPFGGGQQTTRLLNVEELKCGNMSIRFGPISVTASGTYKCEASSITQLPKSMKPSVQTVMGSRNLSVFAYPMDGPVISGLKKHYHAGEFIEAECTAPPSYPAPEMFWSINGIGVCIIQLPVDSFKTNMKYKEDRGLLRGILSLKMMAYAELFSNPGGYALFVCTSILMDTPAMTAEAKAYWSTEPSASTTSNAAANLQEDVILRSKEAEEGEITSSLKKEPPDKQTQPPTGPLEEDQRNRDKAGDEAIIPRQRSHSGGSPSGERRGVSMFSVCISVVPVVSAIRRAIPFTA